MWKTFGLTRHATATVLMLVRPAKHPATPLKETKVPLYSDCCLKRFIVKSTDRTKSIFVFDLQLHLKNITDIRIQQGK